MKTVYFIRHGQTELNRAFVHQYPDTLLSKKGEAQAKIVGEHFKNIDVDVILASPLERAQQTAQAIAGPKGMQIETCNLFAELRRPRVLWGKSWLSLRSIWVMASLYLFAGKEGWHYTDEENLEEFHARARRALEYLADRPEERILVVTHRGFMAALAERINKDGMDTTEQYRRALWKTLAIGNGCYLTAQWTPEGENGATLDGTWTLKGKATCPAGGRYDLGLG
jgi:broad specificity phosphatase PhoE